MTPLVRKLVIFSGQAGIIAACTLGAFLLRFEFDVPRYYWRHLTVATVLFLIVKMAVFERHRLDRLALRFFSLSDLVRLLQANVIGSLIGCMLIFFISPPGFPRAIYLLDFLLCVLSTSMAFLAKRLIREARLSRLVKGKPILIYGAGRAGVMLLSELRANPDLRYSVLGFIDDDPRVLGVDVQGVQVLGSGDDLPIVVGQLGVKEVLIATPSASEEQTLRILSACQAAQVKYKTVAGLGEMIGAKPITSRIREVDVCDLLSRQPVDLDKKAIRENVSGKVVMVTGAAGSIGSELCRQLAAFRPAAIVAFEIAETPLFHLEQEMRLQFPEVPLIREIGNIQNFRRVSAVISRRRPSVVYHAAAYKHVPIMESDIIEAVQNNVCGTYSVIRAAAEHGVEEFVLISSDKAVRPTSVMGVTKRLCELIVRSMANDRMRHVAVRFGNVLGSNGSVIPIFKKQIQDGGPVTVTHPDMERYFMTIPEAAQLVLQASAMGRGGEIFVLDMGSPVKIVDIAKKLILLSGLAPESDIRIEYTGVRPGEKLYEELNLDAEENQPTRHRKIWSFVDTRVAPRWIIQRIEQLEDLCRDGDVMSVLAIIRELAPEYVPSEHALAAASPLRKGVVVQVPPRIAAKAAGS
jgi:FlaA1/EpsC-like NDP-sugar epimerase